MMNSSRQIREHQRSQLEALLLERYQQERSPRKVLPPSLQEASLLGRYLRMEMKKEDPFKDLGLQPAEDPPPRSGQRGPEPGLEDAAEYEPSDPGESGPVPEAPPISDVPQSVPPGGEALEPRRISTSTSGSRGFKGFSCVPANA